MELGYNKPLYILPFDHRNNFAESLFNKRVEELNEEETATITTAKYLIFKSIEVAVKLGIPKDYTGILVDEEYGDKVLTEAVKDGFTTFLTVEKSGQKVFDFQYGEDYQEHIRKYNPTFAKVLIRYNPEDNPDLKRVQNSRLKSISDFCHDNNYKFLLEVLVPATDKQMIEVNGSKSEFDKQLKPKLMVQIIKELQTGGIEPDVWKIEGFYKSADYESAVKQARNNNRNKVSIIVLGRNETDENVKIWLEEGAKVEGVTGFAVGRTVFLPPLIKWFKKELSEEETKKEIAANYFHFYSIFKRQKDLK